MALTSKTYVFQTAKADDVARQSLLSWVRSYCGQDVQCGINGMGNVHFTWSAYKAGHNDMSVRVGSINFGLKLGLES